MYLLEFSILLSGVRRADGRILALALWRLQTAYEYGHGSESVMQLWREYSPYALSVRCSVLGILCADVQLTSPCPGL